MKEDIISVQIWHGSEIRRKVQKACLNIMTPGDEDGMFGCMKVAKRK